MVFRRVHTRMEMRVREKEREGGRRSVRSWTRARGRCRGSCPVRQSGMLFQAGRLSRREGFPRTREKMCQMVEVMEYSTRAMQRQLPGETELNAPPTLPVIDDVGETSPRARKSAPEDTPEQGSLLDRQEPSPTRIGETT